MKKLVFFSLSVIFLIGLLSLLLPTGPRDLPTSHLQVHQILSSRLSPENCRPIGGSVVSSGEHWFWGFPAGIQLPGNITGAIFPVKIEADGTPVMVKGGMYYPSHLVLEGEIDSAKSNLACNPLRSGFPQPISSSTQTGDKWGPIDGCPSPASGWSGSDSPEAASWYGVDLGEPKIILNTVLEFSTPDLPTDYSLEYEERGQWVNIPGQHLYPANPAAGKNLVQFPRLNVQKIRVVLHGGGLLNFQLQGEGARLPLVTEEKFITEDNVLFSCFTFENLSWHFPLNVHFAGLIPWGREKNGKFWYGEMNGREWILGAKNSPDSGKPPGQIEFDFPLQPREKREIRFVLAGDSLRNRAEHKVAQWLSQNLPVNRQVQNFDSWFEQNIPYFYSSNHCLNQAYYLHWNQLRQQLLQVQEKNYNFPAADSEHPDTTINQVNQFLREIRWLRNPVVAQNFVQNYTESALLHKDDFLAFLISGMWELNQVHPDRSFLTGQAEFFENLLRQLAENYDRNENQLLEIASEVGIAGFSSKMYLPGSEIEPVGLNCEFFRAWAALDSITIFRDSHENGRSQNIGQALAEHAWSGNWVSTETSSGAPISEIGRTSLKPFIYDLAKTSHLPAWENVLPRVRATIAAGTLPPLLLRAMLRTWQRFPAGPISTADLSQAFSGYFCKEFFPASAGADGTFLPSVPFDPTRPGIDFMITGIAGMTATSNSDQLLLNPALPDLTYFALENLICHGHKLTIIWDQPDAADYFADKRAGFDIYVDGRLAGSSPRLERLVVKL